MSYNNSIICVMIWDLAYLAFGFAVTFLGLTACKVNDRTINLFYKEIGLVSL
jgi:hypothetical protein